VVIRHPNYFNIPNTIEKETARKMFKLMEDDIVFLSFGVIRNAEQQSDLIMAFRKLKVPKKKMILSNSLYLKKIVAFRMSPIKNLSYKIEKLLLKRQNILIDESRIIDNSIVQYYFKAADIVVLPRINQLNSGVPYLAFSFSKIVVGPDVANIGELLNQTGNCTYKPQDIDSYTNALAKSVRLLTTNVAKQNFAFAHKDCDIHTIGKQQTMLYARLVNATTKT
jgi:hypothetical protein